jgi:predicted metal-dependent phosphoesterase TrpH
VITVPGCEFSTDYSKTELHIVGLFFPPETWESIDLYVQPMREAKAESNHMLIGNLRARGLDITFKEVADITNSNSFNRAHVAQVLVRKGIASTINDAFKRFLSEKTGNYVSFGRVDAFETIRFIRKCGATPILAHPFLNLDVDGLEAFLPAAKECGLEGMETRYSEFTAEETETLERIAQKYGLLQSGGSDYHGAVKPALCLGTGYGDLQVPFDFYQALKDAHKTEEGN